MAKQKWVVVTTAHRGVFFGRQVGVGTKEKLTLAQCRCAIYWSGGKGFLGLSSDGPSSDSKIGAEATEVLLYDITSVSTCTPEAVKVWLAA